jgi:hypothetical protein
MKRLALRITGAGAVLLTIVVLAQLLIGPAAVFHGRRMISERVASTMETTVFLPTVAAAQVWPSFDRFARRYVALWEPAVLVPASSGPYPDMH